MSRFYENVKPYFDAELSQYEALMSSDQPIGAFKHLENAHVIGQESTLLHVVAHARMAQWAIRQQDLKEFLGQLIRIAGAATKTAFGLVPIGNTGGTNVSPFKPLPLSTEHERIVSLAKSDA